MWYIDGAGKRVVVYGPTAAVPELKWLLSNHLEEIPDSFSVPLGADRCVQSMLLEEKSVFRVYPKYAYGPGGSVKVQYLVCL
jgi:hypothetical protein